MVTCRLCHQIKPITEYYSSCVRLSNISGDCKNCYQKRASKTKATAATNYINTYIKYLTNGARANAQRRGLEWNLTEEQVLALLNEQDGRCALTGKHMTHIRGNGRVPTNISIDRVDSDYGYVVDNVQLVCSIVNYMKMELNTTALYEWCRSILENAYAW